MKKPRHLSPGDTVAIVSLSAGTLGEPWAIHKLDIARPIWLDKHEKEVARFGRTAFTQEHFLEPIAFDKFEIEFLRPHGRSTDPRNDFGTNA